MSSTPEERWAKWIELFKRHAVDVDGYQVSTVARVGKDVARFARANPTLGPADIDRDAVEAWTERETWEKRHRYGLRTSLRTFYRWAYRTGRVSADPTEFVSKLQRPRATPLEWLPAVSAYQRYMRTGQAARGTITLRTQQLARIASELPVRNPWDVETEDLVDWLAGHQWARETARQWRTTLRGFYSWGQLMGHIDRNPAHAIPRVRPQGPIPRPATEDAYTVAVAGAEPRTRLMLRLAAELGLRRAEVAAVHSRDLYEGSDGWWLGVNGKGQRHRALPVPSSLVSDLQALPVGYAFPGRGQGHISPRWVGKLVARHLPANVTMHALRHRFATRAYAVDRDVFTVQQLLGHASPTTTQAYVAVPSSDLRRLVNAVNG